MLPLSLAMLYNQVRSFDCCLKFQPNDKASHFLLDLWLNSISLAKGHVFCFVFFSFLFFLIFVNFELGDSTRATSNHWPFGGKVEQKTNMLWIIPTPKPCAPNLGCPSGSPGLRGRMWNNSKGLGSERRQPVIQGLRTDGGAGSMKTQGQQKPVLLKGRHKWH